MSDLGSVAFKGVAECYLQSLFHVSSTQTYTYTSHNTEVNNYYKYVNIFMYTRLMPQKNKHTFALYPKPSEPYDLGVEN